MGVGVGRDGQDGLCRRQLVVGPPVPHFRDARGRGEFGRVHRPQRQVRVVLRRPEPAAARVQRARGGRLQRGVRHRLRSVEHEAPDRPLHGGRGDGQDPLPAGAARDGLLRHGDEGPHGRPHRRRNLPAERHHAQRRSRPVSAARRRRIRRDGEALLRRGRRARGRRQRPLRALPRAVHRRRGRGVHRPRPRQDVRHRPDRRHHQPVRHGHALEGRHLLADRGPDEDALDLRTRLVPRQLARRPAARRGRPRGRPGRVPRRRADELRGQDRFQDAGGRLGGPRRQHRRARAQRRRPRQGPRQAHQREREGLPLLPADRADGLPPPGSGVAAPVRVVGRPRALAAHRPRGRAGGAGDVRAGGRQAARLHLRAGIPGPQLEPAPLPQARRQPRPRRRRRAHRGRAAGRGGERLGRRPLRLAPVRHLPRQRGPRREDPGVVARELPDPADGQSRHVPRPRAELQRDVGHDDAGRLPAGHRALLPTRFGRPGDDRLGRALAAARRVEFDGGRGPRRPAARDERALGGRRLRVLRLAGRRHDARPPRRMALRRGRGGRRRLDRGRARTRGGQRLPGGVHGAGRRRGDQRDLRGRARPVDRSLDGGPRGRLRAGRHHLLRRDGRLGGRFRDLRAPRRPRALLLRCDQRPRLPLRLRFRRRRPAHG